jgi:hypothetical protein
MVATVDDVLAGVRALWAAAGLPAAVSGGLNDSRSVSATFAPPAAVVKITPGEKMTTSANLYFEKFKVEAWVHSRNGVDDRDRIARLLPRLDFAQGRWPVTSGRCVHVRPLPTPTDASPVKNQARDTAITPAAWEVLMQQVRA